MPDQNKNPYQLRQIALLNGAQGALTFPLGIALLAILTRFDDPNSAKAAVAVRKDCVKSHVERTVATHLKQLDTEKFFTAPQALSIDTNMSKTELTECFERESANDRTRYNMFMAIFTSLGALFMFSGAMMIKKSRRDYKEANLLESNLNGPA